MNEDTQNTSTPKVFSEEHHNHVGAILGVLVVMLVIVLGGLYLWGSLIVENGQSEQAERIIPNNEPETPRAEADSQIMGTVSSSDELATIEADLLSTNLDSLDTELNQVDIELNAALQ